jgi:hypothetical protein
MRTRIAIFASALVVMFAVPGVAQPAAASPTPEVVEFIDDFDACPEMPGGIVEHVVVTGTQRILEQVTEDGTGRLHISFTRHTQGTGVGTVSGDEFLLIDSVTRSQVTIGTEGDTILTERFVLLFIRKGEPVPNDDLLAHMITETTITSDGEMTTTVKFESVECR